VTRTTNEKRIGTISKRYIILQRNCSSRRAEKMTSQQDLQDLIRLLASRKLSVLAAMNQVKALQAVDLKR
jgi:hypothetical protein